MACLSLPFALEVPPGRWGREGLNRLLVVVVEGGQAGAVAIGSERVLAKTENVNRSLEYWETLTYTARDITTVVTYSQSHVTQLGKTLGWLQTGNNT